jgi:hypothetical protein
MFPKCHIYDNSKQRICSPRHTTFKINKPEVMICPLKRIYFLQTCQFEAKLYTWMLYRNIEKNFSIVSVRKCLDDLRRNNRCKCKCYWSSENRSNAMKEANSFIPWSDCNESHNSRSRFQWHFHGQRVWNLKIRFCLHLPYLQTETAEGDRLCYPISI